MVIGEAIGDAGPAIILSFVLAGVTCVFSALSYAELASSIPVSGSAYTYAYATLGELVAWIIGWDLILEYGVSVAAVAVGWGGYFNEPARLAVRHHAARRDRRPAGRGRHVQPAGRLPRARGHRAADRRRARERARRTRSWWSSSSRSSSFFIVVGVHRVQRRQLHAVRARTASTASSTRRALIFFAYIGFDAVSTVGRGGEEPAARPADRDHRLAADRTVLYILVAIVAVGALPSDELDGRRRAAGRRARRAAPASTGPATCISFGALVAITSVVLTILYGQTRIMFAMCRDGLLPRGLRAGSAARRHAGRASPLHLRHPDRRPGRVRAARARSPSWSTSARCSRSCIVNIGVIILRRTQPDLERGFRVPFVPVFPIIGVAAVHLPDDASSGRDLAAVRRLAVVGLVIYFVYGLTPLAPAARPGPGRGARRHRRCKHAPAARGVCSVPGRHEGRLRARRAARGARLRDRGRALGRRDGRADRGRPAGRAGAVRPGRGNVPGDRRRDDPLEPARQAAGARPAPRTGSGSRATRTSSMSAAGAGCC